MQQEEGPAEDPVLEPHWVCGVVYATGEGEVFLAEEGSIGCDRDHTRAIAMADRGVQALANEAAPKIKLRKSFLKSKLFDKY